MSDTRPEELAPPAANTAEHERLAPCAGTFRAEVKLGTDSDGESKTMEISYTRVP